MKAKKKGKFGRKPAAAAAATTTPAAAPSTTITPQKPSQPTSTAPTPTPGKENLAQTMPVGKNLGLNNTLDTDLSRANDTALS